MKSKIVFITWAMATAALIVFFATIGNGHCAEFNIDMDPKYNTVNSPYGYLSGMTYICGDTAYMEIWGPITNQDQLFFNDINYLTHTNPPIRKITILLDSNGGDVMTAFSLIGLAKMAEGAGFKIDVVASGRVMSAAVVVFAAFENRTATFGTVFMVHESSRDSGSGGSYSDLKSANQLFEILRGQYFGILIENTKIKDIEQWHQWERDTKWFGLEEAIEIGLVPDWDEKCSDKSCAILEGVDLEKKEE